jgi:hypothetical protein
MRDAMAPKGGGKFRLWFASVAVSLSSGFLLHAQSPGDDLFESKIRPVLSAKCFGCHSSTLKSPMSGLVLDTKAGMAKGGDRGPEIVPGKPAESRLLLALRYTDANLRMPPMGKLPDAVIADFEQWIAMGAPDPRKDTAGAANPAPQRGMSIEEGRKWWAFQPVKELPAPTVKDASWARTKIDSFILAKLEAKGVKPSPAPDGRTLARRAYINLIGLRPTYEEIEAFAADKSSDAYEKLIDHLLASQHYGERWGRHWMDVARYGEDMQGELAYLFAWRYRDWIIEAVNRDVPYDRFVKLQLAADLMPGTSRSDLRALGYLGAAPIYHKDQRLSQVAIDQFAADDWDERVDAVSRGLMALTVACARCHDHKFDAIPTKDYYGLAGVFASTTRAERPIRDIDSKVEARFMYVLQRLSDLYETGNYIYDEPETVADTPKKVAAMNAEMNQLRLEMEGYKDRYPELYARVVKYWIHAPPPAPPGVDLTQRSKGMGLLVALRNLAKRTDRPPVSSEPFMNAVYDASMYIQPWQWKDGADPDLTEIIYKPGVPRDLPVFLHGNPATPGDPAPRHFLTVLSKGDSTFKQGSGRLELAERLFTDAAPLTARVIVNRVWGWHFGRPLVATTSDFGVQGEKPTHPELLDDLAARFIAHGWSLKWLHKEIMLSATYRQASHTRREGQQADAQNLLLWRMNARRMDIESYRDSILRGSGALSEEMYGPSQELDAPGNNRRTVYARISRRGMNVLLRLYDLPDPVQTAPGRDITTTSLQQLFVMNSSFMQEQAKALAARVASQPDNASRIRLLYRKILARDPNPKETDMAMTYLNQGTLARYAQILLSTNEEIYWP